ncbi:MAG: hypothetical protein WCP60_05020 [bacterium]
MKKPNAILSVVFDPGSIDLEPFLGTLEKTSFNGDIVFFVTWATEQQLADLKARGIIVESFSYFHYRKNNPLTFIWPFWKLLFRLLPSLELKKRIGQYVFNMMSVRFVIYHDYLAKHPDKYANILLTDARDVIFQDDPFRDFDEPGVCFFMEDARYTLGNESKCRHMVEASYGTAIADQMGHLPISCAGTTMGPSPAILEYLDLMLDHLFTTRWMHRVCVNDQGIHNYLAHYTLKDRSKQFVNEHGRIHTMGLCKPEDFHFNSEGLMINANGSLIPVLHQYDRFKEIAQSLLAKLA